ncbi:Gypsy retrotransposon integrase-like protein 1 [Hypoxylon texense]
MVQRGQRSKTSVLAISGETVTDCQIDSAEQQGEPHRNGGCQGQRMETKWACRRQNRRFNTWDPLPDATTPVA